MSQEMRSLVSTSTTLSLMRRQQLSTLSAISHSTVHHWSSLTWLLSLPRCKRWLSTCTRILDIMFAWPWLRLVSVCKDISQISPILMSHSTGNLACLLRINWDPKFLTSWRHTCTLISHNYSSKKTLRKSLRRFLSVSETLLMNWGQVVLRHILTSLWEQLNSFSIRALGAKSQEKVATWTTLTKRDKDLRRIATKILTTMK